MASGSRSNPWLWAGLATLVVVGTVVALLMNRPAQDRVPPSAAPSPTTVGTPSVSQSPSPSPTSAPTETPSSGVTATAAPVPTTSPDKAAYCSAFAAILASAPEEDEDGDPDQALDLRELSRTYARLITLYGTAEASAPIDLRDEYATVIQYLQDVKATVDSGDMNAIRAQVRLLRSLNTTMDTIAKESEKLCG